MNGYKQICMNDIINREMKKSILLTALLLHTLFAWSQGFRNPVLPGFHADPSVCRAGDDFYLVNSTFQYFPGVPVFHSKDLVHWEQVGNCLTRPSQVDLKGTDGNSGIYAPTIRYNDGRFYMVTTVFPSRRHFYVWTDNPAGEWSDPIVIDFAIGSCDPTLYFEDGHCYFLWKEGDIKICEIDVKTGKQRGEIHHLGTGLGGRYPEGPHIYKKDGYYYLLLAEGGTEHGHHVNILRSKSLFGPYEPNPANPILSHFNMKMQNSQIQGLGHADLVQAPDSSWWMICLGYRTSGYLQHVMGRETMLAPVVWEQGGWPVVNGDGTLQTDMKCRTLTLVPLAQDPVREEFNYVKRTAPASSYHSLGLPMGWMSLCDPDYSCYSLTERKGFLRLYPSTIDLSQTASPTFVARRQTELNFTATALLDLSHLAEGMQAGITAYAAPLNHYDVVAEKQNGQIVIKSNVRLGQTSHSENEFTLNGTRAWLRITSDKDFYYMQVSSDGANYTPLAKMEYRFLSTETIGGFTGVMLGLFAQSNSETRQGYVDVDWFEYLTPDNSKLQQLANAELKPRLVVCTDIAPADVEPDDMESMVRLMAYADMFEIEAIITSVGWNCDPYPAEWAQYLHRVIEAYGKDVPKLMRRSGQTAFMPLESEGRQQIGYWPSVEYVRSRAVMGSRHGGIKAIGEGNDSEGSRLLIRLADEADERPIYVAAWGGANTLAQAIWRVQQTRSDDEVRNFVSKFRLFTITDQDMKYDMRMNLAYSSHQWLRKDFPDDLQFVWDEGAWQEQCELGKQHWQQHKDGIQGRGALGQEYPTYKWGVEGDTPSMLFVMPNGLNDPEDPRQAGWAGYHQRGRCADSLTTAWGCWNEHVRAISVGYKRRFYPDELSDFLARMQWAEKGEGNRNPLVIIDRHKGHQPIHIDAKAGDTVRLDASKSADPDGDSLTFLWWQQPEIGKARAVIEQPDQPTAIVHIPVDARDTTIHIVCEVHDSGPFHLVAYRRIIIRVTDSSSK
jgi:alpha-N-arabinofuranosidase